MLKSIKKFLVSILLGASCATAFAMVAVGYSDRLDPESHPLLACVGMTFPFFIIANLVVLVLWVLFKWKYMWIPLLAFAFAYVPIRNYVPIHFDKEVPDSCIKIVSYNVCGYDGNHRYSNAHDTIYSYLKKVDADIVCIQEEQNTRINQLTFFLDTYPYNDTVHVSNPTSVNINALGIHSRYPIVKKERIDYKSYSNGSVAFYLKVNDDTVIVVNNHLESTHLSFDDRQRYKDVLRGNMEREDAEAETLLLIEKLSKAMASRASEAKAVHQYVEDHRQYPMIVCGDFNDTPISFTRYTVGQGLHDCYVESGCGPGISYNKKGFNVRIDYIFCSDHFKPFDCQIDSRADYSDHYPISCSLKWTK